MTLPDMLWLLLGCGLGIALSFAVATLCNGRAPQRVETAAFAVPRMDEERL